MLDATGQISGRDHAIKLVRSFMERPESAGEPSSQHYPVLVFEGARGSGKTALLDTLATALAQQVPYARFNFKAKPDATVPEVLSALASKLGRRCPLYGVLDFPRLTAGRLVMREDLELENHPHAREQVMEVLEKECNLKMAREILKVGADTALVAAEEHTGVPAGPLLKRVPELVLDRLTDWKHGRRVLLGSLDWYGHRDRGRKNDAVDELVKLNRWARNPDDEGNQEKIAHTLWDAFLADLRHVFHGSRRANELSLNCVILLDNADEPAGLRFVEQLVQTRALHAAEGNQTPEPMTVAVTSRGELLAHVPPADVIELPAATGAARGPAHHDHRQYWWGRHRLEDLTRDQVAAMVSALALREGSNQRLTSMTLQLTGGHPASTRLLLDAVAERPEKQEDLAAVLDELEPGTAPEWTVAERMRQRLLADFSPEAFDDLVTCAASRERQHALRLANSPLLGGRHHGYAAIVDPVLWPAAKGAGPVLLRRLLVRELARRDNPGLPGWSEVFDWHRDNCANAGDLTGKLHYALANRDLEFVTQRLHERLISDDATSWLELLASVTSAPHRRPDQDDPLAPTDEVFALLKETAPAPSLEPLARLIASLWIVTDPFCGSRRRGLHLLIAADYTDIARLSHRNAEQLLQVALKHRRRAEEWT
ncbi:MAG: hypothetical protein ACRDUV_16250 [Pseudonocardiaceae bacterium]